MCRQKKNYCKEKVEDFYWDSDRLKHLLIQGCDNTQIARRPPTQSGRNSRNMFEKY